jgi:hypothetical protein
MSFREKSAWAMGALMLAAGAWYLAMALGAGRHGGGEGALLAFVPYTLLVVVGSIVAQTALGVLAPKEARAPADERERPILDRAGRWSGLVLAAGAVSSVLGFLLHRDGVVLFHSIMASLIASQTAEYLLQIALFRGRA